MCRVATDTLTDFEPTIELLVTRAIPGQGVTSQILHLALNVITRGTGLPTGAALARDSDLSSFAGPLWSTQPISAAFRMQMSNVAAPAMAAAGVVDSHVEFYEYDLTQAQRYYVNTPTPVISR